MCSIEDSLPENHLAGHPSASALSKLRHRAWETQERAEQSPIAGQIQETYPATSPLPGLKEISNSFPCPAALRDLAANALRREEQGRFDDASARYYSLLEKGAKVELASRYGIDTSNVKPELLPASFLEETTLVPSHDGRLQLPLFKAYLLLACLNNPLGLAFIQHKERLEQVLRIRNSSLLAHGFSPVDADTCGELRSLVFTFLDIRQDSLPLFPTLDTTLFG